MMLDRPVGFVRDDDDALPNGNVPTLMDAVVHEHRAIPELQEGLAAPLGSEQSRGASPSQDEV